MAVVGKWNVILPYLESPYSRESEGLQLQGTWEVEKQKRMISHSSGEGKKDNINAEDPNESSSFPQPNAGTFRSSAYSWKFLQVWHSL